MTLDQECQHAIDYALAHQWEDAHAIVQDLDHPIAHWIHAVLHKIEGDEHNSRYWYQRTSTRYETFHDAREELIHIAKQLNPQ